MSKKVKTPPRLTITEKVDNYSCYDLDGKVTNLLELCQNLIERHGDTVRFDYGQHTAWEDTYSFNVNVHRPETDSEYEARVGSWVINQQKIEERERAELARLTEKYGSIK